MKIPKDHIDVDREHGWIVALLLVLLIFFLATLLWTIT